MTKEEIIKKVIRPDCISVYEPVLVETPFSEVYKAMDVFGKQQAIAFATFRDLYHREQRRKVKEEETRLGGMITWDYSPDTYIYDQFIEQQNKP